MRSNKAILDAINMSKKLGYSKDKTDTTTSDADFKLPPATKTLASSKSIKIAKSSVPDSAGVSRGSKIVDIQFNRENSLGSRHSKKGNDNMEMENIPSAMPVPKQTKADDDLDYDSSALTEKQELALLRSRIMDQRKELENRNEIVTALQRNFEALSMFCKKERGENETLKKMNEDLKKENMKFIEKITNLTDKIKSLSADNELLAKDRVRAKLLTDENQELKLQIKVLENQINTHK